MAGGLRPWQLSLLALFGAFGACDGTPAQPQNPAWADVAPIFRGQCNGCHGWNAGQTGGGYRFDFYDVSTDPTKDVCGDAALAAGTGLAFAGSLTPDGSPVSAPLIESDVVAQKGAAWPRSPVGPRDRSRDQPRPATAPRPSPFSATRRTPAPR